MLLAELDSVGVGNWFKQRGNAAMAALGSQNALHQHSVRLTANKLYQRWMHYIDAYKKQPTSSELARFIAGSYGRDHLAELQQQFPMLQLPPGATDVSAAEPTAQDQIGQQQSLALPAPGSGPAATSDAQPEAQPAAPSPMQPASDVEVEVLRDFMADTKKIDASLMRPQSSDQLKASVVDLAQKYLGKGDKAKQWFAGYINKLKQNSTAIGILPQLANLDPATLLKRPAPAATTANASAIPSIPRPPNGAKVSTSGTVPPAFLRQQRSA